MPARHFCAAEGCHSDTKKIGKYGYMAEVSFFPFPTKLKNPKARKKWLDLLRRKDYDPPRSHRVCSLHFKDGKPTQDNPYPTLFAYNNFKRTDNSVRSNASIKKREVASVSTSTSTSDNVEFPSQTSDCIPEGSYSCGPQVRVSKFIEILHKKYYYYRYVHFIIARVVYIFRMS